MGRTIIVSKRHQPLRDPAECMVRCQGHWHWGLEGAAGLLLRHTDEAGVDRYLLQHRALKVTQYGGTWSTLGGALHTGENPIAGAVREAREEVGNLPEDLAYVGVHVSDECGWAYYTVLLQSPTLFEPVANDKETGDEGFEWFTKDQMEFIPLHPGFAKTYKEI